MDVGFSVPIAFAFGGIGVKAGIYLSAKFFTIGTPKPITAATQLKEPAIIATTINVLSFG